MSIENDEDIRLQALRSLETVNPQELRNQITQLERAKDELEQAYESGDSDDTYAEHRAKLRQFNETIDAYRGELAGASVIQKMRHMTEQEAWVKKVEALKRSSKGSRVDYNRPEHMEKLDRHIRYLGTDPANAGKPLDWFLRTADEMTRARASSGGSSDSPRGLENLKGMDLERALARLSPAEVEAYLNG
jgi:hypothetical protein